MTNAITEAPNGAVPALWISIMAGVSLVSTLALACAMPFEALAAFAALHFGRRDGILLMLLCWAANQAIGFSVLDYPIEFTSLAWSPGLLLATLASLFAARWAAARFAAMQPVLRVPGVLGVAFAAFKAVVLIFAIALGGVATTLSLYYSSVQLMTDSAFLLAFLVLAAALRRLGLPEPLRRARIA